MKKENIVLDHTTYALVYRLVSEARHRSVDWPFLDKFTELLHKLNYLGLGIQELGFERKDCIIGLGWNLRGLKPGCKSPIEPSPGRTSSRKRYWEVEPLQFILKDDLSFDSGNQLGIRSSDIEEYVKVPRRGKLSSVGLRFSLEDGEIKSNLDFNIVYSDFISTKRVKYLLFDVSLDTIKRALSFLQAM